MPCIRSLTGFLVAVCLAAGFLMAVFLLAVAPGSGLIAGETRYRFVPLPGLAGAEPSSATALNERGEIVGSSGGRAVMWRGNLEGEWTMVDLGAPGESGSSAWDINESSVVVGASWEAATRRAFRFRDLDGNGAADPGELDELAPVGAISDSSAVALNDRGEIVGVSGSFVTGSTVATLWGPDGVPVSLGGLFLAGTGFATDINNDGVIVGGSRDLDTQAAWIRDADGLRPFPGVRGLRSVVTTLNDRLQFAGYRVDTAFLSEDGELLDLHGVLPLGADGDEARAESINERGQIVGCINYESEPGGRESAGFLWEDGRGLVLVDTLTEMPPGATTIEATDINDQGHIVGSYRGSSRTRHAFVMIPEGAEREFVRGDSNGDGAVDLSDGITTLEWLFRGRGRPDCLDAADTNDSGDADISDAIALFSFLFNGNAAPPAPGAESCGSDPTPDTLGCASYDCP